MTNPHGSHIWYELITSDADAAQAFYSDVVGWSIGSFGCEEGGTPPAGPDGQPMDYRILTAADGQGVGGLMKAPAEMPIRPCWFGYVGVDDVDKAVDKIVADGGSVQMPAMDLENVGRMAMLADPQGVCFYVMRGASNEDSQAFGMTPGHVAWNELSTTDPAAALAFYEKQFGWSKGDAMPMGDTGDAAVYQFIQHGEAMIGAVMPRQPDGGPPIWCYYVVVPDIDVAADRIKAGGGSLLYEPMEIPGGDFSLAAVDPQGAVFGLVGPRKR